MIPVSRSLSSTELIGVTGAILDAANSAWSRVILTWIQRR